MPDSCVILPHPAAEEAAVPLLSPGALPLAVVLDQRTMLLFGWMPTPPPETATVRFDDGVAHGEWHATSWTGDGGTDVRPHHFLAILQAENIVRAQTMLLVLNVEEGRSRISLPPIERTELDAEPLLECLRSAQADLAHVFDFVNQRLVTDPAQPPSVRIRDFMLAFLSAISIHDGFIEILGRPDSGGLLLQGWSVHLEAGNPDFKLASPSLQTHAASAACFERSDLLSAARGVVAFLKTARDVDLQTLTRVYFKSQRTYFHLDVVEARLALMDLQVVAHLEDMLSRLQGPVGVIRALKRVCRPRFPGHETISALPTPVRLAHDIVLHAPGAGIFVSGWLLDPRKLVTMVLLKSTRHFYARIDTSWVRLPRPDVSDGFAHHPLFAEQLRPWETQHGFVAFVPRPQPVAADEVHYLEIVLEDESCAFLPIKFRDGDKPALLRQILGSVNIGDPAIDRIVGDHLGPFASALSAATASASSATQALCFGRPTTQPQVSIVVPLSDGWADFDINMARLAADPDLRAAQLVVVAPRSSGDAVAHALRRYAPFYDLWVTLVLSDAPLDYHDALEAGVRSASADLLLFLSQAVFPRERGWLSRLLGELARAPDAGAVSPTLLYEDDSVRFAGTSAQPDAETGTLVERFRGYGCHWVDDKQATPVWAGTAECCLVRKKVFNALGGFSQEFMDGGLKTVDFGLRLQDQGSRFYWVPSVTMYALDDDPGEVTEHWARVRRLVDQWSFDRKWSAAIAALGAQKK